MNIDNTNISTVPTVNMISMPMEPPIININTSSSSSSSSDKNNDKKLLDNNTDIEKYIEN